MLGLKILLRGLNQVTEPSSKFLGKFMKGPADISIISTGMLSNTEPFQVQEGLPLAALSQRMWLE